MFAAGGAAALSSSCGIILVDLVRYNLSRPLSYSLNRGITTLLRDITSLHCRHPGVLEMPEITKLTLPVLPLGNGVVFPHMVVTLTIESDEGAVALEAAHGTENRILLVPRVGGHLCASGDHRRDPGRARGFGRRRAWARPGQGRSGSPRREMERCGSTSKSCPTWISPTPALDDMVAEYRAIVVGGARPARHGSGECEESSASIILGSWPTSRCTRLTCRSSRRSNFSRQPISTNGSGNSCRG